MRPTSAWESGVSEERRRVEKRRGERICMIKDGKKGGRSKRELRLI